jgi:outer membrane protein assembly factor BamB
VAAPAVAFALLLPAPDALAAADVSYFRSDGGVAENVKLPTDLSNPQALRWRMEIDPGHSTPVICGNRIVLTTYRAAEPELTTVALDRDSGQLRWKQVVPAGKIEQFHPTTGSPAAATPAWDGQRLYVFFGSYGLVCYDVDGHKQWEYRVGPFQDEYGSSSSPVLVDDKVILCEDHDVDSFLIALDRLTGRVLWRVPRPEAVRSYSTPAVWVRDGRKELLVAGALELAGYDPSSGDKLWWFDGLARIVIPVPVVSGDMVYMASWTPGGDPGQRLALDPWPRALAKWDHNHDGKLTKSEIDDREVLDRFVRMDLDKSGDLDQKEWERHAQVFRRAENAILGLKPSGRGDLSDKALAWKRQRGAPYVATPLIHNGILWVVKDGGIVTQLNASDGKLLQDERLPGLGGYYSSPVAGDGKIYFASEAGVVTVVADEAGWSVLSSREFHEKIYATPVIEHDRILIRTEKALYAFSSNSSAR